MSDGEPAQTNPEHDGAPGSSDPHVGEPAAQAPDDVAAHSRAPSSPSGAQATGGPQAPGDAVPETAVAPGAETSAGHRAPRIGRAAAWGVVAVLVAAAGIVASLVGARAVAHNDESRARTTFQQSSAGIATALKVATQREEDLVVSASTFYAGNPKASPTEFAKWAKWARMLHHYPELDGLALLAQVHTPELAAFQARLSGQPTPAASSLRVLHGGTSGYSCLAAAELSRSPADIPPADENFCALTPALVASRDSARSIFLPLSAGPSGAIAVATPVYRGGPPPATVPGRRAAFVGWLRELLAPRVLVAGTLRGDPESAVRLRYRTGAAVATFTTGTVAPGAQSTTVGLHNGWSARIFGPPAATTVLADSESRWVLIGGCIMSVLLGLLIFVLGAGRRSPTMRRKPKDDLYDPLTGLPGRALTLDLSERMLARAGRQSGMLAGALYIDVDWFKDVNDKLGEAAGDQLLKIVAERLETVVRAGDTVGRLGDDKFLVLVESAARGARLDSLARRVIEALHKPVELDSFGPSFFLTASIGVAFGHYSATDELLRDAHLALDAAKAAGKDRYTMFNANMRSVIEGQGVLGADLNAALADKQFFLLYQPIYDLTSGRVVGTEALIRWLHPTHGILLPSEFISLAEETGLIVPIGRWVLEEACARAAAWNVQGHRVGISTTVSANQLNRQGFATDVRRALQQSGIEPSLLTLEIAESTIMLDMAAATARLEEIKQLGVSIAIDDFGSGYAYRSDLKRMPLDYLKVDRSALAASDDEDYRSWLLEAILLFGRELSLTVIAKGIDTEEHLTSVKEMGCKLAQGYFMGKPVPANLLPGVFDAARAGTAPASSMAHAGSPARPQATSSATTPVASPAPHPGTAVPQTQPAVPEARPAAPQTQPAVPEARPAAPQTQPAVPQARPAAPQVRPAAPQTPPDGPQTPPAGPPAGPAGDLPG